MYLQYVYTMNQLPPDIPFVHFDSKIKNASWKINSVKNFNAKMTIKLCAHTIYKNTYCLPLYYIIIINAKQKQPGAVKKGRGQAK